MNARKAYQLADQDLAFLSHDDTRGMRLELEYLKAESLLSRCARVRAHRGARAPRRDHDRRRTRHHGGRQPRRLRGRRTLDRHEHRSAAGTAGEPLYDARAVAALSLLRPEEAALPAARACDGGLPRRLRHPGRAVRDAHARADAQDKAPSGSARKVRPLAARREHGVPERRRDDPPADRKLFCYAEGARAIWTSIRDWYRRSGQPVFPRA